MQVDEGSTVVKVTITCDLCASDPSSGFAWPTAESEAIVLRLNRISQVLTPNPRDPNPLESG